MLTLVTGLPGASKTLYTLDTVEKLAKKENRPVFYHGIPELTLDWQMLDKAEDWINCPDGSIIVIDECQSAFRPRANGQQVPPHVAKFETHRHQGLDIFLITQHPMLVDGNVRRLAGRHYHVVRFYGFNKSTVHEFDKVRENVDKNLKGSIENHYIYNKDVYGWYKSASMHTVKKRIPMRLFLIIALPIFFVYLIYTGYQALQSVAATSTE
jgi:zona occludens toxin (predicted ATPase)